MVDWSDQVVFIVGGGPSAGEQSLLALKGRGVVIGVNDAGLQLPFRPDVVFSCDGSWIARRHDALADFPREVVLCRPDGRPSQVLGATLYERLEGEGLPRLRGKRLHYAGNSGYGALMLAAARGARRVVLVGFDLVDAGHWHGGYSWPCRFGVADYPEWAGAFDRAIKDLAGHGVEVINTSPRSAITAAVTMALDDVFRTLAHEYWRSGKGLAHITPPDSPAPEGDGFAPWLAALAGPGRVLDFGCGVGRLAGAWPAARYYGADVCWAALSRAADRHPMHTFVLVRPGDPLPAADCTVAHTVLLHVPDQDLDVVVGCFNSPRVLVSEILGRAWRTPGNPPVYNRDRDDYVSAFARAGYRLGRALNWPYSHYDRADLTVLEFELDV